MNVTTCVMALTFLLGVLVMGDLPGRGGDSSCLVKVKAGPGWGRWDSVPVDWGGAADSAAGTLQLRFGWPGTGTFYANSDGDTTLNYWWQAHALDVLTDVWYRTGDSVWQKRMKACCAGVWSRNGQSFVNDFYDDMEWMALAQLRAYVATGDVAFLRQVRVLWDTIQAGWTDVQGGGVSWQMKQRDYKNTPANAPACILAARLYRLGHRPEDLAWAVKIYDWLVRTLVDPVSGLAWDGVNRKGDGQVDKGWLFTYNQGILIGAGVELYGATGKRRYLDDAIRAADAVLRNRAFVEDGVLKEDGSGDGALFKGIFIRYLMGLMQADGCVGDGMRYRAFVAYNAAVFYRGGIERPGFYGGRSWRRAPSGGTELPAQLSGCMLLEAAAALQRGMWMK